MFHKSRQRAAASSAGLLVLAFAAWAWSADEPAQKDKDRRLAATLKDVINRGATLYNSGDQNGSYHLFVGALLVLRPQLEGRADLLKKIDDGLRDAEQHQLVGNRAWALYELLLNVREAVYPEAKKSRPLIREERDRPIEERPPAPEQPREKIVPPKPLDKNAAPKTPEKEVTGTVTGVVSLNGKPLEDAEVRLIPADNLEANGRTVKTDADGTHEFLSVKPGRYVIVVKAAEKDGVTPARYSDPKKTLLQVDVKAGENRKDLSLLITAEELKPAKKLEK
jgi:hypothetical protein